LFSQWLSLFSPAGEKRIIRLEKIGATVRQKLPLNGYNKNKSKKNKLILINENHIYNFLRQRGGSTRWRCSSRKSGCNGCIITYEHDFVLSAKQHNHAQRVYEIQKLLAIDEINQNTCNNSNTIINSVTSKQKDNILVILLKQKGISETIRRAL
jgi:hypothetical protein